MDESRDLPGLIKFSKNLLLEKMCIKGSSCHRKVLPIMPDQNHPESGPRVLIKHFKYSIVLIIMVDLILYMNLTYNFSCKREISTSTVAVNATKIFSVFYSPSLLFYYEKYIKKDSLNLLSPNSGI